MVHGYRGPLAAFLLLLAAAGLLSRAATAGDGDALQGKAYETPEALVEAMIQAASDNDDAALKALAGPQNADLIQSGGDPTVAKARAEFAANAGIFWKLDDNEDGSKTLVVGDARWPFPAPLRQGPAGWSIDAAAGREELLARRIGTNELNAIKLCRSYASAQEQYHEVDRDGDGVREYAQRIRSTPGQQDGLYWEDVDGGDPSPLGPLVEPALEYLQDRQPTDPVSGYLWRVLRYQGPCAPGGSHGYVINGNMIAGYALIGYPADYRKTGVMTFMVSNHGKVYERDMGPNTASMVRGLLSFNPDYTWSVVED